MNDVAYSQALDPLDGLDFMKCGKCRGFKSSSEIVYPTFS